MNVLDHNKLIYNIHSSPASATKGRESKFWVPFLFFILSLEYVHILANITLSRLLTGIIQQDYTPYFLSNHIK